MIRSAPVITPTMPPYDLSSILPTPEPEWKPLPSGSGSIQVYAYNDMNSNGAPGQTEGLVANVTVCLFTAEGEAVSSAVTDQTGKARFENLPEGRYQL